MGATAYIALGSNLGDRRHFLDRAVELLRHRPGVSVQRVSSYYETAPVGGPAEQGQYLNAAAELRTELAPLALLRTLLDVERQLGRVRLERFDPRTIDLDLLLYADQVVDEPGLRVPHPRLHERTFVLEPLVEIAPEVVHPVLHRTMSELLSLLAKDASLPPATRLLPRACGDLLGQRAVVTGSTSGIGRAIALELARSGADVVIHGHRSLAAAEKTAEEARSLGVKTQVLLADLCAAADCQRLVGTSWDLFDGLNIWINNAGADTLTGEAAHWSFERKLEELWAVDVRAAMLLSREVGRRMQERGGGVILNMGWDQAEMGMEGDSGQLFAAIKSAIMAFSKSLALSLAPNVRVNCLAPGWIRTAWGEGASARWHERVKKETPLGRWGTPEDVAQTAHWLVSPAASFITGQVIRINGGAVR